MNVVDKRMGMAAIAAVGGVGVGAAAVEKNVAQERCGKDLWYCCYSSAR